MGSLGHRPDVYDTCGASVCVLQVCRYGYFGGRWNVAKRVFVFCPLCDSLSADVHHSYDEGVDVLDNVDVFLVSVS